MRSPEYTLQCAVAAFLSWALPDDILYTHLPMGGKRDKATAGKLKRMGVNPGWPDFVILCPGTLTSRKFLHNPVLNPETIFIELKAGKGTLSPAQKTFHKQAKALGYPCYIARSIERVAEILEEHGIILKARMA